MFRYKDSKEKNIRRAVIHLLPRMAAFSPERFASGEGRGGGKSACGLDLDQQAWDEARCVGRAGPGLGAQGLSLSYGLERRCADD